jgi:hypothetical protein
MPTMKPPEARSGQVCCTEALAQTTGMGSEIRKNEMAIRKNPSFEYYCRVLAILPSRSLSRVSLKALAWFLGDEGGVNRLSYLAKPAAWSSAFGFCRQKSRPSAKPKEPLFSQRLDNKSYFALMNLNE